MGALADHNVGAYLNRHYVSGFQKVASFLVNGQQKQGGNVAGYFCTPDGLVLHAVAGPLDAQRFLREARWANDTYNFAMLENHKTVAKLRTFFRKAHVERLQNEQHVHVALDRLPSASLSKRGLMLLMEHNMHLNLTEQGKVHLLLAAAPLAHIDQIYQPVFEGVLNERVTTNPVAVAGR